MSRKVMARLSAACLMLSTVALLGANDDGGCGFMASEEELCSSTGGTWGTYASWPPICQANGAVGAAPATNGEMTCACPGNRPNWENGKGCVDRCTQPPAPRPHCKGTVRLCSDFGRDIIGCDEQEGCKGVVCYGDATPCHAIPFESNCRRQDGCSWGI